MARRVDKIHLVGGAVLGGIVERYALRFNSDTALALDIHRIEHLVGHLALAQSAAHLDKAIGERGFTMVDVRNYGKIAYMAQLGHVIGYNLWRDGRRGAQSSLFAGSAPRRTSPVKGHLGVENQSTSIVRKTERPRREKRNATGWSRGSSSSAAS